MKNDKYSQNILLTGKELSKERKYWMEKLGKDFEMSGFPRDSSYSGNEVESSIIRYTLEKEVAEKINYISKNSQYALYMILLSGIKYLLVKYGGRRDVTVAMPAFNQDGNSVSGSDLLALRTELDIEGTFKDFLLEEKKTVMDADKNQNISYENFLVLINEENKELGIKTVVLLDSVHSKMNYNECGADIVFSFSQKEEASIELTVEYSSLKYRKDTIEYIIERLEIFYKTVSQNPQIRLCDIEILSKKEKEKILNTFNDTKSDYPDDKTISFLFHEQVKLNGEKTALVYNNRKFSYNDLEIKSNIVANYLKGEHNVKPDTPVGVIMDKSDELIMVLLGILKADGAYVPIDPKYPEERIKSIVMDASISTIITSKNYISLLNKLQWECESFNKYLCIDSENVYRELLVEKNELMDKKLWEYVAENAQDDIEGGGWVNSYTGENLSDEDMDEYSENIVNKLKPYLNSKTRVLEIGCSSGLSMFKLAPFVSLYYGTDLSSNIINKDIERIDREKIENIKLSCIPADRIDTIEENEFDIVILNSVIQCFNGFNYLRDVIRKAISKIKDKGIIFFGDIMDQDLKHKMIDSLVEFKKKHVGMGYKTKIDWSNELFVSRSFFEDLCSEIKDIEGVEFSNKIFSIENELSMFRYDAVLKISKASNTYIKHKKHKYQHDRRILKNYSSDLPDSKACFNNLAYIMYTSGSTGKPKGVMVEHKNVIRLVKNTNYIEFKEDERMLQTGAIAFDASTFEIWGALLNGYSICLADEDIILSPHKLERFLIDNRITTMWLTSPLFNRLCQQKSEMFRPLRNLLVGGDVLSAKHINEVRKTCPDTRLINGYGPTENTTFSTCFTIDRDFDENIPIGKPISNSTVFIFDQYNKLNPIGIPGELCVGGDGVARGYLNDSELTDKKFVLNEVSDKKIYKTGDMAKWLPDGNIEFLGRFDNQVKIRGFRLEIEEIEKHLLSHEDIKEAVVIARKDSNEDKYLLAYYISDKELSISDLREYMAIELPDFSIPSFFIAVGKMPLTANGKIDRKRLPEPDADIGTGREYEAPTNSIEKKLVEIWSDILDINKIGINDNFFELGGHSLKATVLVARIHKEFNVEVPLREIFNNQTIKKISKYVSNCEENKYSSIEPVKESDYYPLSSAQKRLYILDQFEDINTSYNISGVLVIEGDILKDRVEYALNEIVKRHEAFRTSFHMVDGEPVQRVFDQTLFKMEYSELNCDISNEEVDKIVNEFIRPFDLSKAPLFRVGLVKITNKKHLFIYDIHHIIADGTSISIIANEFADFYMGYDLNELRIQYKDFANWQNDLIKRGIMKKQEEYWMDVFFSDIPVLNMPYDYQRPSVQSFEGDYLSFEIDSELTDSMNKLISETGTTMYMLLLAAYNILLSKYSGQEDIIIGSPIAGRPHADLQNIIGMFVNTLAMRNYPKKDYKFIDFLEDVKNNSLKAYENQDYQFEELIEKLNVKRDISRNPLFDVCFALQNMDTLEIDLPGIKMSTYDFDANVSKFDLWFGAQELEGVINITIQYCTRLYKKDTINRLFTHFKNILVEITKNPYKTIGEIDLLSDEERDKIINGFNNTRTKYPANKTIHEIFEEQVNKTPQNTAVIVGEDTINYRELSQRANCIAKILKERGVKVGDIIGISVDRQIEMIVGIIGILKAGGAYLPISPAYPEDRVEYMLSDSGAKLILTTKGHEKNSFNNMDYVVYLDDSKLYEDECLSIENTNKSTDLAYVIYTSGSTGKPKGVMIEHYSLVNRLNWMQNKYPLDQKDIILQKTPFTFDVSLWELFWWSFVGAGMCMLEPDGEKDPSIIVDTIEKYSITTMHFVPSMLSTFMQYVEDMNCAYNIRSLKRVFCSGEALSINQVQKFNSIINKVCGTKIINLYGPTEATVDVTYYDCPERENIDSVPIGKPIDNINLYIVDEKNKLVPVGVPGELCIAGDGLSRGYLNKPELTNQTFVQNPFAKYMENQKLKGLYNKMYKTGDVAKWRPDGNIEYLGRIDHQVKIRGFRIELGEIEANLVKYEKIVEAVVVDRKDRSKNKYLCAYLVSKDQLTVEQVRGFLLDKLPDYMIPSYIVCMDKLPLTSNGKVDRKALPEPEGLILVDRTRAYVAPINETQRKLVSIWEEILEVEKIGVNDNFFNIGGHSLKATNFVSIVHKEFDVILPLRQVFKTPSINELALYIDRAEKSVYSSIETVGEMEYYPLSSAQKRLYMIEQHEGVGVSYNMPGVMYVEGDVDVSKVREVTNTLAQRHEAFRTSFHYIEGEPVQKISDQVDIDFEYCEGINTSEEQIIEEFIRPFSLDKPPLFRVKLVKISEKRHLLLYDMHHIISDGTSLEIVYNEFISLYAGKELPELKLQYKDFAYWQNSLVYSDYIKKQEDFWMNTFSGKIPVLELPTDFERPNIQSYDGDRVLFNISSELTEKLNSICRKTGATMYMVLLSAFNILLSKYTGQNDLIVGTGIAGRPHRDLENIIGMFVNSLAMRNFIDNENTYLKFLESVKERALKAYENQDYQFERLVDKLELGKDLSRNPLFSVALVLQNMSYKEEEFDVLKFIPYNFEFNTSKFDMTLFAIEQNYMIYFTLEYCTRLFKKETIEELVRAYERILNIITSNDEIRIQDIELVDENQKEKVITSIEEAREFSNLFDDDLDGIF